MGKRVRKVLAAVLSFIMVVGVLPGMNLTAKADGEVSGAENNTTYTVTFDCGGYGTVPSVQELTAGSKVTEPDDPQNGSTFNGLNFVGWYQDPSYQIRYDFDSEVEADLYLYAQWVAKSTSLDDASIKMIYPYTGSNIDSEIENNIGETLSKGTDYEVNSIISEKTNTSVDNMKDPGFYNLTVSGNGSYTGTKEVRVCVLTFGEYDPDTEELNNSATLPEGEDAAIVTASTVSMSTGWYVVTNDVSVNSRIKVNGDVHLVLCEGTTLDVAGEPDTLGNQGTAGISVTEGNSLTIYSQAGKSGKLIASSNNVNYYAAIGGDCPAETNNGSFTYLNGNENGNAGSITIH
ncbi:MAG: InlB B-repeat-containing protein, partial [Lachnospiraceae bacterium]|nr:InlB B-repeat-containing protein [Lachnospiraceae bacterium]